MDGSIASLGASMYLGLRDQGMRTGETALTLGHVTSARKEDVLSNPCVTLPLTWRNRVGESPCGHGRKATATPSAEAYRRRPYSYGLESYYVAPGRFRPRRAMPPSNPPTFKRA